MTTTTEYGTWQTFTPGELSVRQGIERALEGHGEDHDLVAIESSFRNEINTRLRDTGIRLIGDAFFGPAEDCEGCLAAAPGYIAEVLDQVSQIFWTIVIKNRKSTAI